MKPAIPPKEFRNATNGGRLATARAVREPVNPKIS
jgi:hypothetical protein